MQGLAVVGPKARELLQRLTRTDLSKKAFGFMSAIECDIANAPCLVARLSLTGELTYEIYTPALYLPALYQKLLAAGADLGVVDFGIHALVAMRLEKSFGIWSREFSRDYSPAMSGLDRFIDFSKPDFIGRAAALAEKEKGPSQILMTFAVDATDADAAGYEPIWRGEKMVGFVTSGGYGHRVGTSIAMGYVDAEEAGHADGFEISILGDRRAARPVREALYDPTNALARA